VTDERRRLKAIGMRVLGEANDLKRTTEALARDLGWPLADVKAVIAGEADAQTAERLLLAMSSSYPVSLADLWVERDDTDEGVRIMTAAESARSSRVFDRPDRNGQLAPYYEYRDTAMSRTAPFKPEWIKELRVVRSPAADDPDVAFNRGHFMHQTTFFIGAVNFYWETGGRRHVAQMETGDSNYITPFVPHSFASRDPDHPGLIIAVTYAAGVRAALEDFSRLGGRAAEALAGDLRRPDEARRIRLARHLAMESLAPADFVVRLAPHCVDASRARALLDGAAPEARELEACAAVLNVRTADLMLTPLLPAEEVIVRRRADTPARAVPRDGAPGYRVTELARSRQQPLLKGFALDVLGGGEEIVHGLHEYVYNYGDDAVDMAWGANRHAVVQPGDSAYVRPMVPHRFASAARERPGRLVTIRIPGRLTDPVLDEFAAMAAGRHRAAGETERWF
jgi:uncharacterized RmlC-like cupin family protein